MPEPAEGEERTRGSERRKQRRELFDGWDALVNLLSKLVNRPSYGEAPVEEGQSRGRGRRLFDSRRPGIPILYLQRQRQHQNLLSELSNYLSPVPHALFDFSPDKESPDGNQNGASRTSAEADPMLVWQALVDVADQLATPGVVRKRIRFRRLHLVSWLLAKSDSDTKQREEPRKLVADTLYERDVKRRRLSELLDSDGQSSSPGPWIWLITNFGPRLVFWMRLSRFVPFAGKEYKWLREQPNLAPNDPGNVLGFAWRIMSWSSSKRTESADELIQLLVNAFLVDMRVAWRRSVGRPWSGRRNVYPVVLSLSQ